MSNESAQASRLLRAFARSSNLLIATRPFRAAPHGDPVARELEALARRIGALPWDDASPRRLEIDVTTGEARLGGERFTRGSDADARLDFALDHMPVSRDLAKGLASSGAARGVRIGVAMTLEPKTANLALLLAGAGATVSVYAHPDETDPDVAAALARRGVAVHADATLSGGKEAAAALTFLNGPDGTGLDILMDDGSHLIRLAHERAPHLVAAWRGATEETTSGLRPLRLMEGAGLLTTPVIAVNDAPTKTLFDNRYGTAQSCVFAIADLLDTVGVGFDEQPAVVIGYGPVGQGVAAYARALGATVSVVERDAVRALQASHDGYRVGRLEDLAAGAFVISATGVAHTVTAQAIETASAVAVAGGVPGEIDLPSDAPLTPLAPHVDRLEPSGTLILDKGGCINVTAAEGNPIEIMDLSFATQLAALQQVLAGPLAPGVHPLDPARAAHVAATAARSIGLSLAVVPTPASADAQSAASWHSPRYATSRQEGAS